MVATENYEQFAENLQKGNPRKTPASASASWSNTSLPPLPRPTLTGMPRRWVLSTESVVGTPEGRRSYRCQGQGARFTGAALPERHWHCLPSLRHRKARLPKCCKVSGRLDIKNADERR